MTASVEKSVWRDRAERRLEELADCSFENFRQIHAAPFRPLRFGAAGIAYAFWKAACVLESAEWLNCARLWLELTLAGPEDTDRAVMPGGEEFTLNVRDSFFDGNRGVWFVQSLIGFAEENPRLTRKGLEAFTAPAATTEEMQEILQGIGGRLLGCAILIKESSLWRTVIPDNIDLHAYGTNLADELCRTAFKSDDWERPWQDNLYLGMAHGRAGPYYALLRWAKETGWRPPNWLHQALLHYATLATPQEHGIRWGAHEHRPEAHMNSWCNGAPGQIHLYSLAYDIYRDERFLITARESADYCLHEKMHSHGHICCGAAGAAYALLALDRIDPGQSWRQHAFRYAETAYEGIAVARWRLSLYNGLAGVICLMLDMDDPDHAAQPLIEG